MTWYVQPGHGVLRGYKLIIQVAQLTVFAAEVTRVSLEVGTEGKLGGQASVPNVEGTWQVLTDNVNLMVSTQGCCKRTNRRRGSLVGAEPYNSSAIPRRGHHCGRSR